ncbi:MAG: HD-GYP domain-containing protein [Burkholderiaceae bacterium]|uniref:HD-GYP domain-containing protein n=1 Tax=Extensimonas perlucida TaxID=2590786 RepID=UPI00119EF20C|nr:HD domain-containing phosphohydrolase [Extensimonas perlucida]
MSPPSAFSHRGHDGEYEDLLGLWADLESALAILLSAPLQALHFADKVRQLDRWLQDLMAHDTDAGLYLMFQLASTSTVGYSTSHALVCGTLCHVLAQELQLGQRERDSLVHAALTMNIGMTALQDELAQQREKPSAAQQNAIRAHAENGRDLLERLRVQDELWLRVVQLHHTHLPPPGNALSAQAPQERLVRILSTIDRYAAMISPRQSRAGRSITESVRAIFSRSTEATDEVNRALVRALGLCPPGVFVRMDNGDTALVLRRGTATNHPLVASLLDRSGKSYPKPSIYETAGGKPRIESSLPRAAVLLKQDHRTMVRLGLYAAQRSLELVKPHPIAAFP